MNEERDINQLKSRPKKPKKKDEKVKKKDSSVETDIRKVYGASQKAVSPRSRDEVDHPTNVENVTNVKKMTSVENVTKVDSVTVVTRGENEAKPIELKNSRLDEICAQVKQNIAKGDFLEKLEETLMQDGKEEEAVSACRQMFKEEMVRLRTEVEEFKELCVQQVDIQKNMVEKHRGNCEKDLISFTSRNGVKKAEEVDPQLQEQLKLLESSMEFFQHKQKILDEEMDLLNREEALARKQKDLEEYEKEIIEVEAMLNQRQAISSRRQKHLATLDEELFSLRRELEETKEQISQDQTTGATTSEKAQKNWEIVRRNLIDKQHLLELTVQRYRSELASASSNIAGKEIIIAKMTHQLGEKEDLIEAKDRKIKQLESKLAIALNETRLMEDHLQRVLRENSDSVGDNSRLSLGSSRTSQEPVHMRGHFTPDGYHGSGRRSSVYSKRKSVDLSASLPADHFRSPLNKGNSRFTLLTDGRDNGQKPSNGTLSPETNSYKGENLNALIIRRRSTRANSVAGDVSKLTLRTPRDNDNEDFNKSGACAIM
ncbi:plectin-like [Gigantopelta aegis]|uniref:plectin-like n=1 Tax=Gigantopelta aegis TaxID=1735272 RepID=UPI001B88DDAD|nr:plectin-like [Gigantopelta aegis]